jgi:hypothetical protein
VIEDVRYNQIGFEKSIFIGVDTRNMAIGKLFRRTEVLDIAIYDGLVRIHHFAPHLENKCKLNIRKYRLDERFYRYDTIYLT